MPMTQKEMVKLLTAHGWTKTKGGKGSHVKLEKVGERPITIPHGEIRKGYQKASRAVIKAVPRLSLILEVNYACHLSSFILL